MTWQSHKQHVAQASSKIVWTCWLFHELGLAVKGAMPMCYDSQVVNVIANNSYCHEYKKPIKINFLGIWYKILT